MDSAQIFPVCGNILASYGIQSFWSPFCKMSVFGGFRQAALCLSRNWRHDTIRSHFLLITFLTITVVPFQLQRLWRFLSRHRNSVRCDRLVDILRHQIPGCTGQAPQSARWRHRQYEPAATVIWQTQLTIFGCIHWWSHACCQWNPIGGSPLNHAGHDPCWFFDPAGHDRLY